MSPESRCHWCGGDRDQRLDFRLKLKDEPERPVCQDCLREWPPNSE